MPVIQSSAENSEYAEAQGLLGVRGFSQDPEGENLVRYAEPGGFPTPAALSFPACLPEQILSEVLAWRAHMLL